MSDQKVNPATLEFIKKQQTQRRQRRAIASVVGLVMVSGIAFGGYLGWNKYRAKQQTAAAQALVAELQQTRGREGWEKARAAVDSGQVTRDQLQDAMRARWEAEEKKTLDGFFKTPAKDRDKYLDALIDEQQKRMAEWQRNRPTTAPTTRPDRPRGQNGPGTRPTDAERAARGQQRADITSPMQRAQQSEFRAAMAARAKERGISLPGGGRGGPGGGRGGPGGGGR